MSPAPIFPLSCGVQSYDWGKIGKTSKAAIYGVSASEIDESKPYAELWMGTHPSCPSSHFSSDESLAKIIASDPSFYLGDKVIAKFGKDLPFLFKVLAIGKALSIQAHPDKALAKKLFEERPNIYKDGNHKPEMALALTPFRAFVGFRPVSSIASFLISVPEFKALFPEPSISPILSNSGDEAYQLKSIFKALMECSAEKVKEQLSKLVARYSSAGVKVTGVEEEVKDLVLELNAQFPDDVGVFCAFVLNLVMLEKGEGVFLGAGVPHAYISGDIVETMATSDNVVRAGLTPKLRDVPTLVDMLIYKTTKRDEMAMKPETFRSTSHSLLYDPPIEEFSVILTDLPASTSERYPAIEGPSIFITTSGSASLTSGTEEVKLGEGTVVFIAAGQEAIVKSESNGFVGYRSFVEVS